MPNSRTEPDPELLRRARRDVGLTQEAVSELVGLARNSISRYESGSVSPSVVALNMLATVYRKPVDWFFGGEEAPGVPDADVMADPDLSVFFGREWGDLTDSEKKFMRDAILDAAAYLRRRREATGETGVRY